MISNLKELNRILLGVNELSTDEGALIKNVIDYCGDIVLEGSIVNHKETIEFCLFIGLLRRKQDYVLLSETGKTLLSYNTEKNFSLSQTQKDILARECFFKGKLSPEVRKFLQQFSPDYKKKTFVWSKTDGFPLKGNKQFVSLLIQSGILFRTDDTFIINPEYAPLVSSFNASSEAMTDEELKERLEARAIVGKIAENIVVEYEKRRLLSENHKAESDMVQTVSNINVKAGYDVASFDGESQTFDHDRFIEVKGSTGTDMSFLLSSNEIRVAKEKGTQYWLYFVGGIDIESKTSSMEPLIFQDPAATILDSDEFEKNCIRYWVRANSRSRG